MSIKELINYGTFQLFLIPDQKKGFYKFEVIVCLSISLFVCGITPGALTLGLPTFNSVFLEVGAAVSRIINLQYFFEENLGIFAAGLFSSSSKCLVLTTTAHQVRFLDFSV